MTISLQLSVFNNLLLALLLQEGSAREERCKDKLRGDELGRDAPREDDWEEHRDDGASDKAREKRETGLPEGLPGPPPAF